MNVKIIRIGNSRGIRLPKTMLEEVGLGENADLSVQDGKIVITPKASGSREGWAETFASADVSLTSEDQEWLDADLGADADWTW